MSELPQDVVSPLLARLIRGRAHAYVRVDDRGRVRDSGGDLAWFGLESVAVGDDLTERLESLQGFLPAGDANRSLDRVELRPGRSSEVHLVEVPEGSCLVFVDATPAAERELRYQQRGNELSLLLRTWGVAVFEEHVGRYTSLGLAPPWMRALAGGAVELDELLDRLPFLENFLVDARRTWDGHGPRVSWSGMWTEVDDSGLEWHLEASAARIEDGRRLLLVQSIDRRHAEHQRILQEARTRNLDHDRLRREIDKKEMLLHCIVHDLRGPLSGMVGTMSLIKSRALDADRTRELLELGLEQARSQEALIRGILDAFKSEVDALQSFETDAARAPDALACARAVLAGYEAAFEQNGVRGELVSPDGWHEARVVGEASRLERVLYNLIENALRHSPEGGVVRVCIEDAEPSVRVAVEDDGAGIPADLEQDLFQKFRASGKNGAAGLGLYFCRSTIETWGGTIGYRRRAEGGSRFWFRLPRAFADDGAAQVPSE